MRVVDELHFKKEWDQWTYTHKLCTNVCSLHFTDIQTVNMIEMNARSIF